MYKIIIVDDEAVVREGIKNSINRSQNNFELIGDYANGREAWDAIERDKPDLVLSDICMPFMDGLELTQKIQSHFPYIKVIILTGYDDFDYAQQALRLKAYDFILKPITSKELHELLGKVKLEMDEEIKRREDWNRLQIQLNQSMPLLKERFLERMVSSGLPLDNLLERFDYFQLPSIVPGYLAMVIDIDDFGERKDAHSDPEQELLRFAGFNIVEEIMNREKAITFRTREERMVVILSGQQEDGLYELAYWLGEEVRYQVEKYLKFTVTIGVGRACYSLDLLPLSYKSALSALDYRFMLGKNRIVSIVDMEGKSVAVPDTSMEWSRKLATIVKTGSLQDISLLIEQLIASLTTSLIPIEACYLQIQKIIVSLLNAIQELGVNEWALLADQRILLTDVYRFKTLNELEKWLKDICSKAITSISERRNDLIKLQILRAVEYIQEYYSNENISLQELCRHTSMSTSYFSLVFKQYTGETFVEYLTRVRIEKAKELLQHSSLKSYEIASKIGCSDPNYFSILFKKHAGTTPTDYRDKLIKEKL